MLKKFLLLLIAIAFPYLMMAQFTIRGSVLNFETGKPLPGATVQIDGLAKAAASDNDGNFVVS